MQMKVDAGLEDQGTGRQEGAATKQIIIVEEVSKHYDD